ncbi:MAG: adenylyltransferase/cytidyltransferase family protein [Victivallales bacterium]
MSMQKAVAWRNRLRRSGLKLVVTNGCFDLLHRGHAEYLSRARELGDVLLVFINSDSSVRKVKGRNRPIVNEKDRAFLLASLSCVDAVVIFGTSDCVGLFSKIKPDTYVKGGDYDIDSIVQEERVVLEAAGSKIKFIKFVPGLSTTDILARISKG